MALTLVPSTPADAPDDLLPLVPVPADVAAGTAWDTGRDVAWVPAVLLLSLSGRCACDDCCSTLASRRLRAVS